MSFPSSSGPSSGPAVTTPSAPLSGRRTTPLAALPGHPGSDYIADFLNGLREQYEQIAPLLTPNSGSTSPQ